jgi:hypothetical protein
MPTAIHEIVIRRVTREIIRRLDSIAERNDASGEFARNIEDDGSTRLTFSDSDYGPHDPDGSFRHLKANILGSLSKFLTLKRGRTYHVWRMIISLDQTGRFALLLG